MNPSAVNPSMPSVSAAEPPWYRQLWPWLVMIPPAGAVVGGFVTLYLAGAIPVMVVDDYGRIDEISEQRQGRDFRAAELGLLARLQIGDESVESDGSGTRTLTVSLDADAGQELPGLLAVKLYHPTLRGRDHVAFLAGSGGVYRGELAWRPGRYYVEITDADETWQLVGELTEDTRDAMLRAARVVRPAGARR